MIGSSNQVISHDRILTISLDPGHQPRCSHHVIVYDVNAAIIPCLCYRPIISGDTSYYHTVAHNEIISLAFMDNKYFTTQPLIYLHFSDYIKSILGEILFTSLQLGASLWHICGSKLHQISQPLQTTKLDQH